MPTIVLPIEWAWQQPGLILFRSYIKAYVLLCCGSPFWSSLVCSRCFLKLCIYYSNYTSLYIYTIYLPFSTTRIHAEQLFLINATSSRLLFQTNATDHYIVIQESLQQSLPSTSCQAQSSYECNFPYVCHQWLR